MMTPARKREEWITDRCDDLLERAKRRGEAFSAALCDDCWRIAAAEWAAQ